MPASYLNFYIANGLVVVPQYDDDSDGQVLFQASLPDTACRVICDPFGKAVIVGLSSGRIVRLDWGAD